MPAVVDLVNRAYRQAGGWSTESAYLSGPRVSEELLRSDIEHKPAGTLLKWEDAATGHLLGTVWLEPRGAGTWYLGSLAVEPGQQDRGLGRAALGAAEDWVRERGGTRIRMSVVNVRAELIAWYVRRGYRPTGATEPFPYGDDRFGTPLRPDLSFVVLDKDLAQPRPDAGSDPGA